jgi:hypothetical protein
MYHRDKQVTPAMRELVDLVKARLRSDDKQV